VQDIAVSDEYYIYTGGQITGPYLTTQLRSMWDQGLLTSDTQYRTEGMADWHLLSALIEKESLKCPRCATQIAPDARICSACQFSICEHNANKAEAKKTEMNRIRGNEDYHLGELRENNPAAGRGWALACMILGGIVFYLSGPALLSLSMVILGFIAWFVSLARGHQGNYNEQKAIAAARAQNTYDLVTCPSCGSILAEACSPISWASEGGYIDCGTCNRRSFRIKDTLVYVPHPEVSLTGSLEDYVEAATVEQKDVLAREIHSECQFSVDMSSVDPKALDNILGKYMTSPPILSLISNGHDIRTYAARNPREVALFKSLLQKKLRNIRIAEKSC